MRVGDRLLTAVFFFGVFAKDQQKRRPSHDWLSVLHAARREILFMVLVIAFTELEHMLHSKEAPNSQ